MHQITAKGILSAQNGMNLYRGCTHGCIYCDARSNCYQVNPGRDFTDVAVKVNGPELLEQALKSKRRKCMIGTGAMSDPYIPLENQLNMTRRCLELIDHYGFGLAIQTKSDGILRDLDLLKRINEKTKCVVQITLTTYDEDLCRILEPGVCTARRRAEVLNILRDEGIPTVCWLSPFLPFINDTKDNIMGLLDYCREAKVYGVLLFGIGLTLREGNREYYYQQLDQHFPGMKERYIQVYGNAYEIASPNQSQLMKLVKDSCRAAGIVCSKKSLFEYLHLFEDKWSGTQMSLFD